MSEALACAFYGRVSTEDNQDPTLSLPRQLSNCELAVERVGGRIVAHFYDIESGDSSFEERGSGRKLRGFDIPIPRDGGLNDLLELARSGKFAVVVCESINRFARNPSVTFRAEDELRLAGVKLWAIDEPWEESFGSIVLRHVNVGIARGYLHELKVKSRQGLEAACKQGRHAGGIPLYGYVFRELPHPNPHRAREGKRMRILEPDPIRAAVIRVIFDEYVSRGHGIGDIPNKLNSDPERYPPPTAPRPDRSRGFWAKSTVWDILHNPKYTGYQVWNRRARKRGGKQNPPEAWIWSDEPAHEPLVSKEMLERAALKGISNDNRAQKRENEPSAATFVLRSFLRCGICGLRMQGHSGKRGNHYYTRVRRGGGLLVLHLRNIQGPST